MDFDEISWPQVGVHVRRGDKLTLMPGLEAATCPEQVLKLLRKVAPHLRTVPPGLLKAMWPCSRGTWPRTTSPRTTAELLAGESRR